MWVMTSFGILMPSLRPADKIPEGDNRLLQIRTRRRKDLDILRDEYMGDELGDTVELAGTDYEFRAYCTHEAWGRAMAKMSLDIDYVKFKPTTEDKYDDGQLHQLYNSIWSTVFSKLSTEAHQNEYLGLDSGGMYGTVGKYGTRYQGTGSFSYGGSSYRKGKGKISQKKGADKYSSTGGGRQPWWADGDSTPTTTHWWDDDNEYAYEDGDLGAQARKDAENDFLEELNALKRGNGRHSNGNVNFQNLYEMLEDMDPALKPVITADGQIDHLYCDHGISKSAKKRCRARWRRYAVQRVRREFGASR